MICETRQGTKRNPNAYFDPVLVVLYRVARQCNQLAATLIKLRRKLLHAGELSRTDWGKISGVRE